MVCCTRLDHDSRFYFLHSYYFHCKKKEDVIAVTDYGGEFACAVNSGNIYGVQFHPEKSHQWGIQLLEKLCGTIKMLRPRIIPCLLVKEQRPCKNNQF